GTVESTGPGHGPPTGTHCRELPPNATGCVEVVAHGTLTLTGTINADTGDGGTQGTSWIDLFAAGDITINRPSLPYAVHANGLAGTNDTGGAIRIFSVGGSVTTSGFVATANATGAGGDGGTIAIQDASATTIALGTSTIQALGANTGGGVPTG